jgi:MFS family permease
LRKLYSYSFVAFVTLICYYFGVSLIRIPQDKQWTFVALLFGGYFVLGFIFGFLFSRGILTSFALVFVLGFLGAMLSTVSYNVLLSQETLSQTLQNWANYLVASFFIGIAVGAGAFVNTLCAWIVRRLAGKGKSQRNRQTNEHPSQTAEVI